MENQSCVLTLTTAGKTVRQGVAMRKKLLSYWILTVLLVFALFLAVLSLTGVFSHPARRLHQDLAVSLADTGSDVTGHLDTLEARSIQLSRKTSEELGSVLEPGERIQSLNDRQEALQALEKTLLPSLESILRTGQCSGVFLILDATVNTKAPNASHSRSGLYLRCQGLYAANPVNQSITCYRGFASAARSAGIELHNRWNPEFDIDSLPGFSALMGQNISSLSGSLFWTRGITIPGTWENVLLLCVPVTLGDGTVCGLCGIEISALYFRLSYPAKEGEFGNRITALCFSEDGALSLKGGMIGRQEGSAVDTEQDLAEEKGQYFSTFTAQDAAYAGLEKSLPFRTLDGSTMTLAVLVPLEGYQYAAAKNTVTWVAGSAAILAAMLLLGLLFTGRFVRPIKKRLQTAKQDGGTCGILEIDALLEAMQAGNSEGLPPKVASFLDEFRDRVKTLTPMERTVLQYYIDGYGIEEIAVKAFISVNTVKKHNTNLNRKLGVSTREELRVYIEIFRRSGRIDEISYP